MTAPLRKTDWIMTASGIPFWPLEPAVDDVRLGDIAHHLSHLCRFTGAVKAFYSVAQHSVLVSMTMERHTAAVASPAVAREAALFGLLHDAAEAYLMDVPRPLKQDPAFAYYRTTEARLQAVIYRRFDLDPAKEPPSLKFIDRRMLRTEQRDLMPPPAHDEVRTDVEPFPSISVAEPWNPLRARWAFVRRHAELSGGAVPSPLDVIPGLMRGSDLKGRA